MWRGGSLSKLTNTLFSLLVLLVGVCYSFGQSYVPVPFTHVGGSGGTVTVGINSNSGNDGGGDANVVIFTPILIPNNGSNYTLNAFHTVKGTSAGNMITGIYSSTNAGCPTGVGVCPGTRVCQSSSTASTSGDQTLNPTSCGSLTASNIYWLATIASSNTLTYSNNSGFGCPANGLGIQFAAQGGFALPASGGTTTLQPDCFQNYAVLTCTGACGTTVPNYTIVDYSGGTATGAVGVTDITNSTHCINGGWLVGGGGAINNLTYQSSPTQAFLNSAFAPCNQTTYTGSSPGLVIRRVTGANDQPPNDQLVYFTNTASHSLTSGHWFSTDTPQNVTNGTVCDFYQLQASSSSAMIYQFIGNGTNLSLRFEQLPGSATFAGPSISSSTFYFITGQHNPGGTDHALTYDTSGSQVGSQVDLTGQGAGNVTGIALGEQGTCFTSPVANIWYGGIKLDPTGSIFPVLAFFPDSPAVIGPQLAELVRDGKIQRATIKFDEVANSQRWWSFALGRYL